MPTESAKTAAGAAELNQPLAERMRPATLEEIVGQDHLLAPTAPLRTLLAAAKVPSMILWGPPGTGKTTLARLAAADTGARFEAISAVLGGVKELREAVARAQAARTGLLPQASVLFVDEIHRFNKAQQDALLPHVEDGTITLIGATTENPSFAVNGALLSRMRVYVLKSLGIEALQSLIERAQRALGPPALPRDWQQHICAMADGDGRRALTLAETAASFLAAGGEATPAALERVTGQALRRFDKQGDYFYDQISALHKSVRGSDPDAALYWLARMLDAGADPAYLARRMVRMAVEDLGLADPRALQVALDGWRAYQQLGPPEGELALAQVAVYLASAPKSNAVYAGYSAAQQAVTGHGHLEVPLHLRNAPTALAKTLGHGKDYQYDHDFPEHKASTQNYLPTELLGSVFYSPTEQGLEARIAERLARLRSAPGEGA